MPDLPSELIRNLGGCRSGRLLFHVPLNAKMDADAVLLAPNDYGRLVRGSEGDPFAFFVHAGCSSCEVGHEAWRAFTKNEWSDGWLTDHGVTTDAWIDVNLPKWYRSPLNQNGKNGTLPPPITKIAVWNPQYPNNSCKRFKIQAKRYPSDDWFDIREECKIRSYESRKKHVFSITYKDSNGEPYPSYADIPRYMYFRIVILEAEGEDQVGFSRIDLMGLVDHIEVIKDRDAFQYIGSGKYHYYLPSYKESFYFKDNDGNEAEWGRTFKARNVPGQPDAQEHALTIGWCSWYPGYYASRSATIAICRTLLDPIGFHVNFGAGSTINGNNSDHQFFRTKDYALSFGADNYEGWRTNYCLRITKDGIHWSKPFHGEYSQYRMSFINTDTDGGYSNKGMSISANTNEYYGLSVYENDISWSKYILPFTYDIWASTFGGIFGFTTAIDPNNPPAGWFEEDPNPDVGLVYKFANYRGEFYRSQLPARYNSVDPRYTPPRSEKRAYNWLFQYVDGVYFALARTYPRYYYDEISDRWLLLTTMMMYWSIDGFKTVHKVEVCKKVIGDAFTSYGVYCKSSSRNGREGTYYLVDGGRNPDPPGGDGKRRYRSYIIGSIKKGESDEVTIYSGLGSFEVGFSYTADITGAFRDPAYDRVVVLDDLTEYEGSPIDQVVRFGLTNYQSLLDHTLEFYCDKLTIPGMACFPTAFFKNSWSSNSYDTGGFVMCGKAFSAQNAMIDVDNMTLPGPTTWGHDNE